MTRRARSSSSSSSVYAKTPQHLLVVLPKRRRREPVVAARTGRHPEWPTRVAVRSGDRMLDLFVESPRIELRYVIHRFGCQCLLSRNMLCVKGIDDFQRRLGPRPIGVHSVELIVGEAPLFRRRESRVGSRSDRRIASTMRAQSASSRTHSATHASSTAVG